MHANPDDPNATNNTTEAWGGNRARPELIRKFFPLDNAPEGQSYDVAKAAGDDRALFCTEGRTLNIEKTTEFTNGYAVAKWTNFRSDNGATKNAQFPDTDFFLFRLAEAYLTYAEADARLNGGNVSANGLTYIKALRDRAHANSNINVFTLADIEDEWSREFGFEGRRRMDMVRFGNFTGTSRIWIGGTAAGGTMSAYRNIFPLPSSDLIANPNLKQNPNY
jgi:hypothetical protein